MRSHLRRGTYQPDPATRMPRLRRPRPRPRARHAWDRTVRTSDVDDTWGSEPRHHDTLVRGGLEFIIEAMVDAVVVVDAEGRITLANSGAAQLTHYSRDELRGMAVAKLMVDESSGLRTVVRRRIEDGNVLRREESWLVTKDGERVPVSITGSPVLDDEGALKGIVLVARDVREMRQLLADKEAEIARRKQAEDELRAANASIEEKLEQT